MLPAASELLLTSALSAAAVTRPVALLYVRLVTLSVAGTWSWLTSTVVDVPPQVTVYWAAESRSVSRLLSPS